MPYFKWRGIDLEGNIKKGLTKARSNSYLDEFLLHENIACLSSEQQKSGSLMSPITQAMIGGFLKNLTVLLEAGLFLDQALCLLYEQTKEKAFKEIIDEMYHEIKSGRSLSATLALYPDLFDFLTIQLISAGQESGNVVGALTMLVEMDTIRADFYKKIRSALAMPLLTVIFFIIVTVFILVMIVPLFRNMISQGSHQDDYYILIVADFIQHYGLLMMSTFFLMSCVLLKIRSMNKALKRWSDKVMIQLPIVGKLMRFYYCMYILYSWALLLSGKVSMVKTLITVTQLMNNSYINTYYQDIARRVEHGKNISVAMQSNKLFDNDIISIVRIGEETGRLSIMLFKAADIYKERIHKILFFITTILQPALMIMLGILILMLISSVYIPIINLSYSIA